MCFRPFKAVISLQFTGRSPAAETQHPKLWQLKCPPNPCSMKPSLHPLTTIISYKLYIANGQFAWVYYILSKCMCTNINLSLTLTETEVSPHLGQLGTLTTTSKPETARVARWTCPILAEPMGTLPFFVFENFMAHMPFKQNISSKIVFNKIKSTILSSTFFFVRYFCFPSVEKSEKKTHNIHPALDCVGLDDFTAYSTTRKPTTNSARHVAVFSHLVKTGKDRLDWLTQGFRNQGLHLLGRSGEKKMTGRSGKTGGGVRTSLNLLLNMYQVERFFKGLHLLVWFGVLWFGLVVVFVFQLWEAMEEIRFRRP